MNKWYQNDAKDSVILASFVSIHRNLADFPFPARLEP